MIKVAKFGGSSLANAEQFKKVATIIQNDPTIKYVVPSAPGKRKDEDTKVTDMLLDCFNKAIAKQDFTKKLETIKARFQEIIDNLGLNLSLTEEFIEIEKRLLTNPTKDYVASRGEYLNSKLLSAFLQFQFVDAKEIIVINDEGHLVEKDSTIKMKAYLKDIDKAIIPGFYGANTQGDIKTFSRGGSDITGSIVATIMNADVYENWTDVSGFLVADPRIVPHAKVIDVITYNELRELSYMGASVIHEEAISPVRKHGITIHIRNTNRPEDHGTIIMKDSNKDSNYMITGIAGKKHFVAINIEKDLMNYEVGFGRKVLEVFENNHIPFEHAPTSIDSMSIYAHRNEFDDKHDKVVEEIKNAVHPDMIEIVGDLALIAVVGRNIRSTRGIAHRLFETLDTQGINIKMINHGASELNIIIGVKNTEFNKAIQAIYKEFID